MTETVTVAVYERLAACPWVRPEAVARGRQLLLSDHLPSDEELARALMEWSRGVWSR